MGFVLVLAGCCSRSSCQLKSQLGLSNINARLFRLAASIGDSMRDMPGGDVFAGGFDVHHLVVEINVGTERTQELAFFTATQKH